MGYMDIKRAEIINEALETFWLAKIDLIDSYLLALQGEKGEDGSFVLDDDISLIVGSWSYITNTVVLKYRGENHYYNVDVVFETIQNMASIFDCDLQKMKKIITILMD